jgi:NDP-sugar pyrophosphorylase family protein
MKAMIFSAGLGTRFKPWTNTHPKALARVNEKSLLQRNVEYLQSYGITHLVVNIHHFPEQIIDEIKINKGWGSTIEISDEKDELLDTGGGLLKARKFLANNTFLTINVDILTNLQLDKFTQFHKDQEALISLAVTNRKTTRYLLFNTQNRLTGWRNIDSGLERIAIETPTPNLKAYSGIALFQPDIFDLIPFTGKFSLIDVYLALAPYHRILGYDHSGDKLVDVGKPESVSRAESLFE